MSYTAFSRKQRRVLTWWMSGSRDSGYEAIVCDGAVRSGKTMAMGLSFFLWAMTGFDGQRFGLCGKTITSLRRNLLTELLPYLRRMMPEAVYGALTFASAPDELLDAARTSEFSHF